MTELIGNDLIYAKYIGTTQRHLNLTNGDDVSSSSLLGGYGVVEGVRRKTTGRNAGDLVFQVKRARHYRTRTWCQTWRCAI